MGIQDCLEQSCAAAQSSASSASSSASSAANSASSAANSAGSANASAIASASSANFKGAWNSGTTYTVPSSVERNGIYYNALRTTINDDPASSPNDWVEQALDLTPARAIGNINNPLLDLPLNNNLTMKQGVGSVTFTRSTTATYVDRYGVLQNAAVDEARFEKEGLLIEGASTNSMIHSDNDDASWSASNGTLTLNQLGVDNLNNMTKITTNAGVDAFISSSNTITLTTGGHITISVYAHRLTCNGELLLKTSGAPLNSTTTDTIFDLNGDGSVLNVKPDITAIIVHIRDDIYKLSISFAPDVTGPYSVLLVDRETASSTFGMEKIQTEELPFATSYIPTVASPVTRAGDRCVISARGNVTVSEATIAVDVKRLFHNDFGWSNDGYVFENRFITNNFIIFRATGIIDGYGYNRVQLSGINQDDENRYILVTSPNQTEFYVNGELKGTENQLAYSITANEEIILGCTSSYSDNRYLYGHIKNLRVWDRALTAEEAKLA